MKLKIEIDCDNNAFKDGNLIDEILRVVARGTTNLSNSLRSTYNVDYELESVECPLFDSNGNRVGILVYED